MKFPLKNIEKISLKKTFLSVKRDILSYFSNLSKDEKDAISLSLIIHTVIFTLIMIAPYTTNLDTLKKVKKETVVVFDLENLKLSEKDNLPKRAVKTTPTKKQKPIAKKPVPVKKKIKEKAPVQQTSKKAPSNSLDVAKKVNSKEVKKNNKSKTPIKKVETIKSGSMEDLLKSIDQIKTNTSKRNSINNEIDNIKKNLEKKKAQELAAKEVKSAPAPIEDKETPKAFSESSENSDVEDKELSVSYITAIKHKIKGCWNIDPGAKDIQNMTIGLETTLTPDGNIDKISIDNINRYNSSSSYKAAADSARRALIDCAPYNLPMDKYSIWKDIKFYFNPSRGAIE